MSVSFRRGALATALMLAATAAAQAQTPAFGCYERIYSAAHMAANPAQKVTRIVVNLGEFEGDASVNMAAGAGVGVSFRDHKAQWWAGGACRAEGPALNCGMDGDAGRAIIKPDAAGLRLEIPDYVSVEADKPDGDLDHRSINGPAHRVFILARAAKNACAPKK